MPLKKTNVMKILKFEDRLYNTMEIAEILDTSIMAVFQMLYRMRKKYTIKFIKKYEKGIKYYYQGKDLREYFNQKWAAYTYKLKISDLLKIIKLKNEDERIAALRKITGYGE